MREIDAKEKWCPFSRVLPGILRDGVMTLGTKSGVSAHNRVQEEGASTATWHGAMCCVGRNCMLWHETHVSQTWFVQSKGPHSDYVEWTCDPSKDPNAASYPVKEGKYEPHGYCGLAVKP